MNKFVIVALFAFVACAVAHPVQQEEINDEPSELALFETDEVETAGLKGDKSIFADYCIQSRDILKSNLKQGVNLGTATIFNMVVDTVNQITNKMGDAERKAVETGSEEINKNFMAATSAFRNVFANMGDSAKSEISGIANQFREQLTREKLQEKAEEACVYISTQLKPELERKLAEYKREMSNSDKAAQFADLIKSTKIENVGCVTTGRVSKIAKACQIIQLVGPQVVDFMG